MSGDSIDSAVNRSKNREVFVGAGVKYLGKDRQRDAELLADFMVAQIDLISASASVGIAPNPDIDPALMKQIGEQAIQHAEEIAHVAVRAMTAMFLKMLIVEARARADTQN
jgi:hypothetical protein